MKKLWSKYKSLRSRPISIRAVRKSIRPICSIPGNSNRAGKQLSNWLTSYIRPFHVSFWTILGCPSRHLEEGERSFEIWEKSSIPGSWIWRSTRRIEALEREFEFSFFFSIFLVLCVFLLVWIPVICSWTCMANHPSRGDGL
jgi:hypothetical protein